MTSSPHPRRPQPSGRTREAQRRRRAKKRRQARLRVFFTGFACLALIAALATTGAALWKKYLPAVETTASADGSLSAALPAAPSLPPPDPQPVISTVKFSATGDNLIHDGIYTQARQRTQDGSYDFGPLYENLRGFYAGFDVNWINQETLVTDELPPSSYPQFCTPAACGQAIYDLGMRVIAMANNHTYDKYAEGIAATLRFWDSMPDDVVTTGLWADEADYSRIPMHEVNGVKIAYLAYTQYTNGLPIPQGAAAHMILTEQEDVIQRQVELARQQADVVVVGCHWGTEGSHTIHDSQRALGQKLADWGADVIIGTHPHMVQGIDMLTSADGRSVPIAYSLGNFVSTQMYADNMISYIFTFDITKTTQPDGTSSIAIDHVRAVPAVTHYDAGYKNVREYLLRDYTPELAAAHGCRANSPAFSYDYIRQVLADNIEQQYIQWD